MLWLWVLLCVLFLSVLFAVFSGRRSVGIAARRRGWFLVPEEVDPPPIVRDLIASGQRLAPATPGREAPTSLGSAPLRPRARG